MGFNCNWNDYYEIFIIGNEIVFFIWEFCCEEVVDNDVRIIISIDLFLVVKNGYNYIDIEVLLINN